MVIGDGKIGAGAKRRGRGYKEQVEGEEGRLSVCSCEGRMSPIASFSKRIRMAGGRVHCKLCEFLIKKKKT